MTHNVVQPWPRITCVPKNDIKYATAAMPIMLDALQKAWKVNTVGKTKTLIPETVIEDFRPINNQLPIFPSPQTCRQSLLDGPTLALTTAPPQEQYPRHHLQRPLKPPSSLVQQQQQQDSPSRQYTTPQNPPVHNPPAFTFYSFYPFYPHDSSFWSSTSQLPKPPSAFARSALPTQLSVQRTFQGDPILYFPSHAR